MKKNILFVLTAGIILFVTGKAWGICTQLSGQFYYTATELTLHLQDVIYNDSNQSILLVRIFHNKLAEGFIDIFRRYTLLIDFRFFISFLSFIGLIGIFFAVWYIFRLHKRKLISVFFILLIIPLVEITFHFNISMKITFLYLVVPYMLFSLYGHYLYLDRNMNKWTIPLYICLIAISIGFLSFFPNELYNYCIK